MSSGSGDYSTALSNSFLSIDKDLQEEQELQTELGGTTAIVVLVRDNMIYCANAGDSRAVACVAGRVKELSFDHKPYNQGEQARIFRAGGWVEFNRVNVQVIWHCLEQLLTSTSNVTRTFHRQSRLSLLTLR
jgi:protein phosphatase 2C family protein 2/3